MNMPNGAQQLNAGTLFTIGDGTPNGKTIGSVAEVQVKRILTNQSFFESSIRNTAIAEQIINLGGIQTAIYRIAHRIVWGANYDAITGADEKRQSASHTSFKLNKILNIKYVIEDYDVARLMSGTPEIRATLIGEWMGSIIMNLIMNKNLIFKQAVKTWCIASYDKNSITPTVLVADRTKLKSKEDIIAFQTQILDLMTKKMKTINKTTIGTNPQDYDISMSYELYNAMLPGYTQFIDNTGAKALARGTWYENSAMGFPIEKDITLQINYPKGTDAEINSDVNYDLTGVDGMILHRGDWAQPDSFQGIFQNKNPDTNNLQWVGKYLGALPMSLRGLSAIIMDHEPTAQEVEAAKKACVAQDQDYSNGSDWETYRVQLAQWDPLSKSDGGNTKEALSSVLTTTDLGNISDFAVETIIAGVKAVNPLLANATLSITDKKNNDGKGSATVHAIEYNGSVGVSFTYTNTLMFVSQSEADEFKEMSKQLLQAQKQIKILQEQEAKAEQEAKEVEENKEG